MAELLQEFTRFIWMATHCTYGTWHTYEKEKKDLMNVEWHQAAADPRPTVRLYRLPESTPTMAIYYHYSARKLTLIYHPIEECLKAEST